MKAGALLVGLAAVVGAYFVMRDDDEEDTAPEEEEETPTHPLDPVDDDLDDDPLALKVDNALRSGDPLHMILVAEEIQLRHEGHPKAVEWTELLMLDAYQTALEHDDPAVKEKVAEMLTEFSPEIGDRWDLLAVEVLDSIPRPGPMPGALRQRYEAALESDDLEFIDDVALELADARYWDELGYLSIHRDLVTGTLPVAA